MARFYCYECLRKFTPRRLCGSTVCPHCNCELRKVKSSKTAAQVVTRLSRLRGLKPPSRKSDYEKYLQSDKWKTIRQRILKRDNNTCVECGAKAAQVHHLSYYPAVMAGEDDSQLVSLCVPCHEKHHPKLQKRRRKPKGEQPPVKQSTKKPAKKKKPKPTKPPKQSRKMQCSDCGSTRPVLAKERFATAKPRCYLCGGPMNLPREIYIEPAVSVPSAAYSPSTAVSGNSMYSPGNRRVEQLNG